MRGSGRSDRAVAVYPRQGFSKVSTVSCGGATPQPCAHQAKVVAPSRRATIAVRSISRLAWMSTNSPQDVNCILTFLVRKPLYVIDIGSASVARHLDAYRFAAISACNEIG
jgi:hypothetical protein